MRDYFVPTLSLRGWLSPVNATLFHRVEARTRSRLMGCLLLDPATSVSLYGMVSFFPRFFISALFKRNMTVIIAPGRGVFVTGGCFSTSRNSLCTQEWDILRTRSPISLSFNFSAVKSRTNGNNVNHRGERLDWTSLIIFLSNLNLLRINSSQGIIYGVDAT